MCICTWDDDLQLHYTSVKRVGLRIKEEDESQKKQRDFMGNALRQYNET